MFKYMKKSSEYQQLGITRKNTRVIWNVTRRKKEPLLRRESLQLNLQDF